MDNKSTDNSKNIMEKYNCIYENCKCIYLEENSGSPCTPRTIGINNASGNFLMFIDADDTYDKDICKILYQKINEEKCNVVSCNHNTVKNKEILKKSFFNLTEKEIDINPLDDPTIIKENLKWSMIWDKIYRKGFLNQHKIRFPKDISAEDTYFIIKILIYDKIIFLNDYYGYNWNLYDFSYSHVNNVENWLIGWNAIINLLNDNNKNKVIPYLMNITLRDIFSVLIIQKLEKTDKIKELMELYKFEKKLGYKINFDLKIDQIIFNLILNKKFNQIIFLFNFLRMCNNSNFLRKIYTLIRKITYKN